MAPRTKSWPELPYEAWKDTYATLHMWTQIAGKIRLVQTPWLNHSWHVVLYLSPRGLTTSPIPYGDRSFQLEFDFIDHVLVASTGDGAVKRIGLHPRTVADFYAELMRTLAGLGIEIRINDMPNELPDPIRFSQDRTHASYDPEFAARHWRLLARSRAGAVPVPHRLHRQEQPGSFFLGELRSGGYALLGAARAASSRRRAASARRRGPRGLFARGQQRGLLARQRSHPVSGVLRLCLSGAARLRSSRHRPRRFVLQRRPPANISCPTTRCATPTNPERALMDFLMSTYEAAASLGKWDRAALDCAIGVPGKPRAIEA